MWKYCIQIKTTLQNSSKGTDSWCNRAAVKFNFPSSFDLASVPFIFNGEHQEKKKICKWGKQEINKELWNVYQITGQSLSPGLHQIDEYLRFMILMDGVHPEMDTCIIVEYKGARFLIS